TMVLMSEQSTAGANAPTPPTASEPDQAAGGGQALTDRGSNRSQRPTSAAFRRLIADRWAERPDTEQQAGPAATCAAVRRARLSGLFPGERLVVPAGPLVTRSNDTDYRFRPHSAFAHLTGLGTDQEPDAVLVLHPVADGHEAVLYVRPMAGRDSEEFFADARYGEFWVGARPSLDDLAAVTGIPTVSLADLPDAIAKDVGPGGVHVRVVPAADDEVGDLVDQVRQESGLTDSELAEADAELAE